VTAHERARGSRDRELGADLLLLNTAFSGPQLVDVLARESTRAVICDEEFIPLIDEVPDDVLRVIAWQDTPDHDRASVDSLIASVSAGAAPEPPGQPGRAILLTSGTTGTLDTVEPSTGAARDATPGRRSCRDTQRPDPSKTLRPATRPQGNAGRRCQSLAGQAADALAAAIAP
jgi:hypothetical protein